MSIMCVQYLPNWHFQEGSQPIHYAAFQGQTEAIELLVDKYGVDPGVLSEVCYTH